MLDLLTTSMSIVEDKAEQGRDITASEQCKENLKAYQAWFKRNRSTRDALLSCIHDDLLGEFEHYHTAKDIWA